MIDFYKCSCGHILIEHGPIGCSKKTCQCGFTRQQLTINATIDRAEAAEARAAGLTTQRDTAWAELREIRTVINADENEATADEVRRMVSQLATEKQNTAQALSDAMRFESERNAAIDSCEDYKHMVYALNPLCKRLKKESDEYGDQLATAHETIVQLNQQIAQAVVNSIRG